MKQTFSLLTMGLLLLKNILAQYQAAGAAQGLIDGIIAAIAELEKVAGTEVTAGQLESLRVAIPDWGAKVPPVVE